MTALFDKAFSPLPPFRKGRFRIEIMRPEFNESDWEAVMSSRESLRIWSDSEWPEDEFSLTQNLEDMAAHIDDHAARRAYAYSVLSDDGNLCLGSIYVKPIAVMNEYWKPDEMLERAMKKIVTRVDFWLRDSEVASGGDEALVKAILEWIGGNWVGGVAFSLRKNMDKRRQAYLAAGLRELGTASSRETEQTITMFGR